MFSNDETEIKHQKSSVLNRRYRNQLLAAITGETKGKQIWKLFLYINYILFIFSSVNIIFSWHRNWLELAYTAETAVPWFTHKLRSVSGAGLMDWFTIRFRLSGRRYIWFAIKSNWTKMVFVFNGSAIYSKLI